MKHKNFIHEELYLYSRKQLLLKKKKNSLCKGPFTIVNIYVFVQSVRRGGRGHEASVLIFKCWYFLNAATWRLWLRDWERHITDCFATAVIYKNETRSDLGNSFTLECLLPPLVWLLLPSFSDKLEASREWGNELAQYSKPRRWDSNPGPLDWHNLLFSNPTY